MVGLQCNSKNTELKVFNHEAPESKRLPKIEDIRQLQVPNFMGYEVQKNNRQ